MGDEKLTLRGARDALLLSRGLSGPDGAPLYAYRFEAAEYEGVRDLLRAHGVTILRELAGPALLVVYLAEWFRRERHGGGWDWVTPLGLVGIRYHPSDPRADIRYPEVRDAVERGLRSWGRPAPVRQSLLSTIVQESGFPAADVAKGRLGHWLRRSLLTAETGLNVYDAVAAEAWRAPETLVQALFESAVKLCDAILGLRRRVAASGAGEALSTLDRVEPAWRTSLPFDIRDDDFRVLVEDLVSARGVEDPALWIERTYVRTRAGWSSKAEVKLGGELDERRSPPDLLTGLASYSRARVYPRGEATSWTTPIAVLEREADDDDRERWRIRPLVSCYRPVLGPGEALRLAIEAGSGQVAEFIPFGGEPLSGPAIVLQLVASDDPREATELTVLGESPLQTTRPWLVLALTEQAASTIVVEGESLYLPDPAADGRRLLAFSGAARLVVDGETLVWRSRATSERAERIVLVGPRVRKVRESIFSGAPTVWLQHEGRTASVRPSETFWKPVGHGRWRSLTTAPPRGTVFIAVRRNGDISAITRAGVAPESLNLNVDGNARSLKISGSAGAAIRAFSGSSPLPVVANSDDVGVALDCLPPGGAVRLRFDWESPVEMSLDAPLAQPMLLDPEGREAARHLHLTTARLAGYRLLTPEVRELLLEGRSAGASPTFTSRRVTGSTPLEAFTHVVEELLGAFDDLDAVVRLSWADKGDWFAEVRRWSSARPPRSTQNDSPFAVLATQMAPRRNAISLFAPSAGAASDLHEASPTELAERLRRDLAPGPWLLTGCDADGSVLRPEILQDRLTPPGIHHPTVTIAELITAASAPSAHDVVAASADDLRWLVDLCTAAQKIDAPYAAVEPLRKLAKSPVLAPSVLAACRTPEERYAVLGLQTALPFLWCTTTMGGWRSAFGQAYYQLRDQLAGTGFETPGKMAATVVARALGQIAQATPVLSTHARLALLPFHQFLPASDMPPALGRTSIPASLGEIAQRLVTRRPDDLVVALPKLAERVEDQAAICQRFGDRFADVLAAPLVAARIAAGRMPPEPWLQASCRSAWTWDREYFEEAFGAALLAEAKAPEPSETN